MNLRRLSNTEQPYLEINREERNVVALLYAALLQGDNVVRLLHTLNRDLPIHQDDLAIYVEYAFVRDLWSAVGKDNNLKREAITLLLDTADVHGLANATPTEWNEHFGVRSTKEIESPANWVVSRFGQTVTDHADFLATCRFKWAFRVKPDLVIHTTRDHALVIEAKVESGEGSYPTNPTETAIFRQRGLSRVSQTELQEYMMRELLGIDARHVFLTLRGKKQQLSWRAAFGALDLSGMPSWSRRWIGRY